MQPDARRGGLRGNFGARKLPQYCADEGASMADGGNRDLDVAISFETVDRVLDPGNRDGLPIRRAARRNDNLIAFEFEHPIRSTGDGLELLALKRGQEPPSVRHDRWR